MTALAKRLATALIFCVGAGGALGCELISTVDRSKIEGGTDTGTGGGGGGTSTSSTTTGSTSTSTSTTGSTSTSTSTSSSGGTGGSGTSASSSSGTGGSAPACGDGTVDPGEPCDDGNLVDLDGCSSACTIDAFTESGSNDTVATANGPFTPSPALILHGTIQPGSDVDVFAIVLPATADLRLETFDAAGPSSCNNIDTELTLIGTDGTTVLATDDDGGVEACSKLDAKSNPAVAHLPAGTYYAKVGAYDGFKPIPGYALVVAFEALCGDGIKQGHEECDGGATCAATCDRIATCGDGFIDGAEQCDDGNAASGDGCSAICQYEELGETEPDDTAATASGPFKPNALLSGAITPGTDVDFFAITLPATADLKIQTFDAAGPASCAGIDTVVTLIGTDGTTTLLQRDQGGLNSCGAIDSAKPADGAASHLPAGTYFVEVEDYQNDTVIPGYTLLVTFDALCGDGVVAGAEECDGGAGCTATCDRVPVCGDGLVDAPEQCDDGDTASGDGCDAACAFETTPETEPNDTAATAGGPFAPYALITAAITPGSDVDYFEIVLAATSDLDLETFDGNGPGSCSGIDTVLTLYGSDGTTELASIDDGGLGNCSRLDPTIDAGPRHLAAGTYFIKIEDFQNNTSIPAYMLQIKATARCGDGKIEGSEECDGGAACDATCDRIPTCGDGFIDAPETCDDGNAGAGDGCGATCLIEAIAEIEPNDDLASADASAVTITASTVVSGAIGPALDKDFFTMLLSQPTILRLETFDPGGDDCSIQTTLRVWSGAGVELYADDNSGIFTCSALVVALPAGSYYVSVEERTGALPIAGYLLQAKFEASAGLELEPDDTANAATALPGSDIFVTGNHAVNTDSDFYAVTVPAGKSLRAEIVEGDAETCESNDIDSFLTLFDANGLALGGDDDAGRGFCSLIDGTGASPADGYAHDLAAGTYYLLVEAAPGAQAPGDTAGQFVYDLAITLR